MANNGVIAAAAIIIIIIVVGGIYVAMGNQNVSPSSTTSAPSTTMASTTIQTAQPGSATTPVVMTDPPQAPKGTQAFVVSYSSLQVQETGPSGSGWISATGSGSVNLISTINSSALIGYVNLTAGSTVTAAQFAVTSAYIVVNGTTYNVTIPNQTVSAQVVGQGTIVANSSTAIVIYITPTVTATYSGNSTAFVMAPASTRAVVVANANVSTSIGIGSIVALSGSTKASLAASAPSIAITSASVSSANNVTTVTATVQDNSSSSVTLNTLALYGPQNVFTANGSAFVTGGSVVGGSGGKVILNVTGNPLQAIGLNIKGFQTTDFVVSANGTLSVPSSWASYTGSSGITIAPGSSVTLTYSGSPSYNSGTYKTRSEAGASYRIVVVGTGGAWAATNVTGN